LTSPEPTRLAPSAPTPQPERGYLARRWHRLNGSQRIGGVDLARGLAVIGMFAAHLIVLGPVHLSDPVSWLVVAHGRSSILFATLAGVSIGLVTGGPTPLRGDAMRTARGRLAIRALGLWILGLLPIMLNVPVYVILPAYGILFLLALPFVGLRAPVVLSIAAALAVVMPFALVFLYALPIWYGPGGGLIAAGVGWYYPFPVWIAFVLAGLGVVRAGILRTRVQLWMVGGGALLTAVGYGLDFGTRSMSWTTSPYVHQVWTSSPHSSGVLEVVGSGGFAIAVIGACLLVCRTFLRWVALPLRAVGAMPLTAYTVQILSWAIVGTFVIGNVFDIQAFRSLHPFWPLAICTVVGCTAWALLVGRGPLEWVFDRGTRLAVPSRKPPREAPAEASEPPQ
jgi:uncharacterized membrane protein